MLAYQDDFHTEDRTMIADVPTKGKRTLYTYLGDWFIYLNILFLLFIIASTIRKRRLSH